MFDLTCVNGNPTFDQRRLLWGKLERLRPRRNGPWCCIGDFNEMLSINEKDGCRPIAPIRLSLFRYFLNSTGMMDLDLKGNCFTWAGNPRDGVVTCQKIDRVIVNWSWRDLYPNDVGIAMPIINSDHSPIVLLPQPPARVNRSFTYESFWEEHPDCRNVALMGGGVIQLLLIGVCFRKKQKTVKEP